MIADVKAAMFEGLWRSASGDEIHLVQYDEAVSGTYTSLEPTANLARRSRVLVGTADSDIIGFVTSSIAPRTITSWTGRFVQPSLARPAELHAVCHAVVSTTSQTNPSQQALLETIVFTRVEGFRSAEVYVASLFQV